MIEARLHFLVAGDPRQETGGYRYDRQILAGLRRQGWSGRLVGLPGRFPDPDAAAAGALARALEALPEGSCVILDGLVMGGLPMVLARHAQRLRLVAMVHHPLADETGLPAEPARRLRHTERQALARVDRVIVSSPFTAARLRAVYGVASHRLFVVEPGLDDRPAVSADAVPATQPPCLLCVATLIPRKGHRVLIEALARLRHLSWSCHCIGDLQRDPDCTRAVRHAIRHWKLEDRVHLLGVQPRDRLVAAYRRAWVLVHPSFYEGYGMVIAEALAQGTPVVATDAGALADTVPADSGLRVPTGDVSALAGALQRILLEPGLRDQLARASRVRARRFGTWAQAAAQFAAALRADIKGPGGSGLGDPHAG